MCVDAANLTASIDAVNFLLTLANAQSIFKKLTLSVTPSKFQLFFTMLFFDFLQNKRGVLKNINAEITINPKERRKLTSVNGRATGFKRKIFQLVFFSYTE